MRPTLLAYADKDSVRPGDRIAFKVSCEASDRYRAEIVRLTCCETGADGPGFKEMKISSAIDGTYPGRRQEIGIGSYIVVPEFSTIAALTSFTAMAIIWPTRPGSHEQALMGTWNEERSDGFCLCLDAMGALATKLKTDEQEIFFSTKIPLSPQRWHLVATAVDAKTGTVMLHQETLPDHRLPLEPPISKEMQGINIRRCGSGAFLMAAWIRNQKGNRIRTAAHFDGKIERPHILARALQFNEIKDIAKNGIPDSLRDFIVASWDFSADISSDRIRDTSTHGLHGTAVNLPTRGVTGVDWRGNCWSWRHARKQYGAIHFHSDDLYDAAWETDFSLEVPLTMTSGVYAARLTTNNTEFYVPFYVRPPSDCRTSDILFLVPTATYMAYANNRGRVTSPLTDAVMGRLTVVDDIDLQLLERPEIGLSTYDAHVDDSSVHYGSRLRPLTNHRPKDSDISAAHNNFAADLLIIDWLEHLGMSFDVITDEDLHYEGALALKDYRVVVTGTHPEYYSSGMLDALETFRNEGGRLMYLGGNGFFWRVAFHSEKPGVIEVRRAQVNVPRWNPGPGQYFHSFSGEHGGLWRDLGRPPQQLVGVGFISQGFDSSSYYRRTPDSRTPRVAFMFGGVDDEILGNFGLMRGGAAGLEIDRHDERYGSPSHALVVASSEGHSNVYGPFEEVLEEPNAFSEHRPSIRSDIVFFECPKGGAVFSVGSIAYAGSLSHNNYQNNISRLTENVLRRFLDPLPFEMPAVDLT